MSLIKKRSWSTALGDFEPSPDSFRRLDVSLQNANLTTATAFQNEHDIEGAEVIPSGTYPRSLLDGRGDVNSLEPRNLPLETSPKPTARNQELNQHFQADNEALHETPISPLSDLQTLSTPLSTEEGVAPVDACQANVVCYGQVRYVPGSFSFTADSRNVR